jgi:stage V sporulation protein S
VVGRGLAQVSAVGHSASRSTLAVVIRAFRVRRSASGEALPLILVLRQSGVSQSGHCSAAVTVAARRQVQMPPAESEILKVSAQSKPSAVAGAIAGVMREKGRAEVQAIGAGAVNQAVKAIAIARGYLAPSGLDVVCIPSFTDVMINNEERTALRLIVESR